jgi:hypothetical protein
MWQHQGEGCGNVRGVVSVEHCGSIKVRGVAM